MKKFLLVSGVVIFFAGCAHQPTAAPVITPETASPTSSATIPAQAAAPANSFEESLTTPNTESEIARIDTFVKKNDAEVFGDWQFASFVPEADKDKPNAGKVTAAMYVQNKTGVITYKNTSTAARTVEKFYFDNGALVYRAKETKAFKDGKEVETFVTVSYVQDGKLINLKRTLTGESVEQYKADRKDFPFDAGKEKKLFADNVIPQSKAYLTEALPLLK